MLKAYPGALLFLGVLLPYIAFASAGVFIAVKEFSAALTPHLDGRPLTRSKRKLVVGSWLGVLLGIAVAIGVYGYLGYAFGGSFLSRLPEGERSPVFKYMFVVVLIAICLRGLRDHRLNYLEYRKRTNFRVWLRGMQDNGLGAAHEYYLAGWVFREVREAVSVTMIFGVLKVVVIAMTAGQNQGSISSSDWGSMGAGVAAVVAVFLLRALFMRLWLVVRPDYGLADLCTNPAVLRMPPAARSAPTTFSMHSPSAWRGQEHEDSFKIASLLEWCVRRAHGRYAAHDYDRLVLAGRRLAQSLRLNALNVRSDDQRSGQAYEERRFLALQLATARDPLIFADRVAEMAANDPVPPELPRRRAARVVEAVSNGINVHWPAVKIVAIVAAIALLIWSGKLMDAVGLLK